MDVLEKQIRKNGFIYTLQKKGKRAYVYEQYCPENDKIVGWEVFQIKVDKPKVVFGVELGEREIFPGNEDFGKWAWSYSSLERVEEKYQYLENKPETNVESPEEEQ
jgi:hypothetical protein